MAAITDIKHPRWPRDLKAFALFAAIWAAWLTARIVMRDVTYSSQMPLEAIILGMKFDGYVARIVLVVQAMAVSTLALGLAAQRRWGLGFAFYACSKWSQQHHFHDGVHGRHRGGKQRAAGRFLGVIACCFLYICGFAAATSCTMKIHQLEAH